MRLHSGIFLLGFMVTSFVTIISFGSFFSVVLEAKFEFSLRSSDFAILKFTIWQAFLSAFISVFLAIPISRAFSRRNFPCKNIILTSLGAPFILPVIIAIVGFVIVFGRSGYLNSALDLIGFPKFSIYGLHGIILVHVFFNLPLAIRLVFAGWQSIPTERFRLAAQMNLSPFKFFQLVELPMLRIVTPGIFVIIFLICLSSFVVALAFGGGPKVTTVELAIYQAFRFDFDLSRASSLALLQFAICTVAVLLSYKFTLPPVFSPNLSRVSERWDNLNLLSKGLDLLFITVTLSFIAAPIIAIFLNGAPHLPKIALKLFEPTLRSLAMALCSAISATFVALVLGYVSARTASYRGLMYEFVGYFPITLSPLLLGTGLFICLLPFVDPNRVAIPMVVVVNCLMAIPFLLRILLPTLNSAITDFGKLSQSLGFTEWQFLKLVILPKLAQPLGFSFGLAAAISVGDFGVIALFSLSDNVTLPMTLYSFMGAYRVHEAAATATVLLFVSVGLFILGDWGGRYFARSK